MSVRIFTFRFAFLLLAIVMISAAPRAAFAACSAPVGEEGELIYNADNKVVQFCDGTNWVRMGASQDSRLGTLTANKWCAVNAGGTAIDCTQNAPAATAGADTQVIFNDGGTALGGDADLVWNKTANRLTVAATGFVKSGQVELTPVASGAPVGGTGGAWNTDGTHVWRTAGRVGITNATPLARLDLGNTAADNKPLIRFTSVAAATGVDYTGYQHNDVLIGSRVVGGYPLHYLSFGYTGDPGRKFQIGSANNATFASAAFQPHMTIEAGGEVGIGTDTPTKLLHIVGAGGGAIAGLRVEDPNTAAGGFAHITLRDRGPASADDEIWDMRVSDAGKLLFGTLNDAESAFPSLVTFQRDGNVGIGTLTPAEKLHVVGAIKTTGANANYTASSASFDFASGGGRIFSTGANTSTKGAFQIALITSDGSAASVPFYANATGLVGINTQSVTHQFEVQQTAAVNTSAIGIRKDVSNIASVYLNASNQFVLTVNNNQGVYLTAGATSWASASDARLKTNVETFSVLERLKDYRAVSFDWKENGKRDLGVIAQEIQKVFPEVVHEGNQDATLDADKAGMWTVMYDKLGALALEGVKELKALLDTHDTRIAALESENAALKEQNAAILKRLDALEAKQ